MTQVDKVVEKLTHSLIRMLGVAPKRPSHPIPLTKRSASEMRCRFKPLRGKRCIKRSGGPRYHYLCSEHR